MRLVAPTWIEPQVWWDGQQSSDRERDEHVQHSLLFIYSRILPDLKNFLAAVDKHEQTRRWLGNTEDAGEYQQEIHIPRARLWRAYDRLKLCRRHDACSMPSSQPPSEHNKRLVAKLAIACPAWVAYADENACGERKWFAAATRVRGQALEAMDDSFPSEDGKALQVLLVQPRIQPYVSKSDANMPHMTAKFWFPLPSVSTEAVKTLVVVSDSSLDNPGFIYGMQREASLIQSTSVRLLWIAMCPGAGAKELARAWTKAPRCHYGLTVVNLNDCVEGTRYEFTDQNREDLQELVREADKNCTVRSDLFINHADFFPQLHPRYKVLVPVYTRAAQAVNATVHDGFESLHAIKLRDSMHFAPESTLEVVKMYISAVRVMMDQQPTRDVQQHADARMAATPDIISSDEEFESSDSLEHWRPESPPESRESAEDVRQHLLEKFHKWNIDHEEKRPVPRCLSLEGQTLLPSCMPARLSKDDDRFNEKKKGARLCLRHTVVQTGRPLFVQTNAVSACRVRVRGLLQ